MNTYTPHIRFARHYLTVCQWAERTPTVFYALLIDTININAVHLHNPTLTDLLEVISGSDLL